MEPHNNIYLGIHVTVQAVLRCKSLSVDFSRSQIWGKLGTGVEGICLMNCAKFPPNRTMCSSSRDAIRPQAFKQKTKNKVNSHSFSLVLFAMSAQDTSGCQAVVKP